jgi:hypothetical protein
MWSRTIFITFPTFLPALYGMDEVVDIALDCYLLPGTFSFPLEVFSSSFFSIF